MNYDIQNEINTFVKTLGNLKGAGYDVEQLADYAYVIKPQKKARISLPENRPIALTLMALTHGNETAGVAVLNELLRMLGGTALQFNIPICFILGNPWAAKEGKRFLEKDLNRSFGSEGQNTREERRAKSLEKILKQTNFLLDIHQTIEPAENPFFIFPHTKQGFEFARDISPRTPIVTHWGKGFSKDGMCTDEYTNIHGGVGISVELGQAGFSSYQVAEGFKLGLYAIDTVSAHFSKRTFDARRKDVEEAPIYTWSQVIDYPDGDVELAAGLKNFQKVGKGEIIGQVDGNDIELEFGGRILFPKYWSEGTGTKRPAELVRVMKKVRVGELPQSDENEETIIEQAVRIQKEKKASEKLKSSEGTNQDSVAEADVGKNDMKNEMDLSGSAQDEPIGDLPRNADGMVLQ